MADKQRRTGRAQSKGPDEDATDADLIAAARAVGGAASVDLAREESDLAVARAASQERWRATMEQLAARSKTTSSYGDVTDWRPFPDEMSDPSPAWRSAETALLDGIDLDVLRGRLLEWFIANGHAKRTRGKVVHIRPLALGDARGKAVTQALTSVLSMRKMWAAERLADQRWTTVLEELGSALHIAAAGGQVRSAEEARHGSSSSERQQLTDRVLSAAARLVADVEALWHAQTRYETDSLRAVDRGRGRGSKRWLAEVESGLARAGFTNAEIAKLTDDGSPAARGRVKQRLSLLRRR